MFLYGFYYWVVNETFFRERRQVSDASRSLITKPLNQLGNYTIVVTERTIIDISTCERTSLCSMPSLVMRGCKTLFFFIKIRKRQKRYYSKKYSESRIK